MVVEYVVDALRYVTEEGTTLRRSMLCSRPICLESRLLYRYFINACSVKKFFQESKRGKQHIFKLPCLSLNYPEVFYYFVIPGKTCLIRPKFIFLAN